MTAAFRAQAQAAMQQLIAARTDQMVDTCTVARPAELGQTPELDPDTGNPVVPAGIEVYDGPCTFGQLVDADLRAVTSDEQSGVPVRNTLRVPHGTGLRPGDVVTCTAAMVSPNLVGDVFTVVRQSEKTYASSERYFLRGSSWLSPEAGP